MPKPERDVVSWPGPGIREGDAIISSVGAMHRTPVVRRPRCSAGAGTRRPSRSHPVTDDNFSHATRNGLGRHPKATTAEGGSGQPVSRSSSRRILRSAASVIGFSTAFPAFGGVVAARKTCIDLRLISDTLRLSELAKMLDDVVVQHDRDARLPPGRDRSAALTLRKIVLFTHGNAPSRHDWPCARR